MIKILYFSDLKKGIQKMWYIYTMEYYSVFKKNEVMPFAATWIDLETVILSEVRQRRRNIIGHPLYVESKKKYIICNLFTKLKETHGLREQTYGCQVVGSWGVVGWRGRRTGRNS